MLGRNLINFAKGNIAGAAVATKTALYIRPRIAAETLLIKCYPAKADFEKLVKDDALFHADHSKRLIPYLLNDVYTRHGAPESGKFWTQSVGSFFEKLLPKK